MRTLAAIVLALAVHGAAFGQTHLPPTRTTITEGVHLFSTPPYGAVGLDGNSVAIVGGDGVLVFDTNGTPAAAANVLAEIRRITDRPIRYVVYSHWHWDHWYGTQVYQQAFPGVQIVAQERTRAMMMGPALAFNQPGLDRQLPGYIQSLEKQVATAEAATPPAADLPRLQQALQDARFFLDQKNRVRHVFPDVTFARELNLYLGNRRVQVRHHDRAVTPGDTFLYLPDDRILITGDLLINPISFALSCYPTGWLRTLEHLDSLDFSVLVPGHGEPLRDHALLRSTMAVFRVLLRRGKEEKEKGLDADQAKAVIVPELQELIVGMVGPDTRRQEALKVQLVDWYLHRVYDELNGVLTDAIAPIPPK